MSHYSRKLLLQVLLSSFESYVCIEVRVVLAYVDMPKEGCYRQVRPSTFLEGAMLLQVIAGSIPIKYNEKILCFNKSEV
jgi:hypothetical protein